MDTARVEIDRKSKEDYKMCVRRAGIAWIEIITLCICFVNFMFSRRLTARHSLMFFTAERPVCVPYRRKGTTPDRMIPKKVGSKSARRERVYKRAAETRRDFFRRGGTTE